MFVARRCTNEKAVIASCCVGKMLASSMRFTSIKTWFVAPVPKSKMILAPIQNVFVIGGILPRDWDG